MKLIFYRKSQSPCKDCSDRTAICHGECEKYTEWVKKEKIISDKIATAKIQSREIDGYFKNKKKRLRQLHNAKKGKTI